MLLAALAALPSTLATLSSAALAALSAEALLAALSAAVLAGAALRSAAFLVGFLRLLGLLGGTIALLLSLSVVHKSLDRLLQIALTFSPLLRGGALLVAALGEGLGDTLRIILDLDTGRALEGRAEHLLAALLGAVGGGELAGDAGLLLAGLLEVSVHLAHTAALLANRLHLLEIEVVEGQINRSRRVAHWRRGALRFGDNASGATVTGATTAGTAKAATAAATSSAAASASAAEATASAATTAASSTTTASGESHVLSL